MAVKGVYIQGIPAKGLEGLKLRCDIRVVWGGEKHKLDILPIFAHEMTVHKSMMNIIIILLVIPNVCHYTQILSEILS